jgi:hypothetical protein
MSDRTIPLFVVNPEMKIPFSRLRRRRKYIIKTDQIGCGGVDRIQLAVVNVVMNVRVIQEARNYFTI